MATDPVIADYGEFVDVLQLLRKGRLLVHSDCPPGRWLIDGGGIVYHAHETLAEYRLIEELRAPSGAEVHAPHLHWYRLSGRGRAFADRACAQWKARPLWQRCWLRVAG